MDTELVAAGLTIDDLPEGVEQDRIDRHGQVPTPARVESLDEGTLFLG